LSLKSEVQRIILLKCLEARGEYIPLVDLVDQVKEIVKYRASAALSLNSKALEERGYIMRKTVNRRIYIALKPEVAQSTRKLLGIEAPNLLISGYTWNPQKPEDLTPIKNYIDAIIKLEKEGIKINKIVCFTTPQAREKRIQHKIKPEPNIEIEEPFQTYQTNLEWIQSKLEEQIRQNIWTHNIIIDITPLTKLYTIAAINTAKKYGIKTIYHFAEKIIWI